MTNASAAILVIITLALAEYLFHRDKEKSLRKKTESLKERVADLILFAPMRAWHLITIAVQKPLGLYNWIYRRRLLKAIHSDKRKR